MYLHALLAATLLGWAGARAMLDGPALDRLLPGWTAPSAIPPVDTGGGTVEDTGVPSDTGAQDTGAGDDDDDTGAADTGAQDTGGGGDDTGAGETGVLPGGDTGGDTGLLPKDEWTDLPKWQRPEEGCGGCATGGAPAGAAWLLVLAGLAAGARRRA